MRRPGRAIHPVAGPEARSGLGIAAYAAHARLPLSCEGRVEGRPGCGVGRWVGGRGGGERWSVGPGPAIPCPPRRGGPPPPLASPCRRGVVRTLLVGGPPPRVRGVRCHPSAAGRIAIVRLVVECPSHHWPCVAVPGEGRGGRPGVGAAVVGMGGDRSAVGPSPARVAKVPAVRALLPSRRAMRGGRHRACPARPVAKCVWARCRGRSPPLTPRCAGFHQVRDSPGGMEGF